MATWTARLVKIRVPGAGRGTGWAVGETGVLTASSLVALLAGASDGPSDAAVAAVEVVPGASPGQSFDAHLIWYDDVLGLALVRIAADRRGEWRALLGPVDAADPPPLLAYADPGEQVPVVVVGYPGSAESTDRNSVSWLLTHPEEVEGKLRAGTARSSLSTVAVERRSLPKPVRRHGMSGSPVLFEQSGWMVLGLVTAAASGRKVGGFEVRPFPDPGAHAAFREALEAVGAPPVVVAKDGPMLARFVLPGSLNESLRAIPAADVRDPGWFGTRRARADITPPREPYFPFVGRPERNALAAAMDRAVAGTGRRIIVVRGPSAAGKSRLVAEVVRNHAALADFRILAARPDRPILDLPATLRPERTVVWMDNAQRYPSWWWSHDAARRLVDENPAVIVLATVLDPPDGAGATRLVDPGRHDTDARRRGRSVSAGVPVAGASLSGLRSVLDDASLTETIEVLAAPDWQPAPSSSTVVARALRRAAEDGLGLGEFLSGYRDLADYYTAAEWVVRAVVTVVADWDLSGISDPLPVTVARTLWDRLATTRLPRDELRRFARLSDADLDARWRAATAAACHQVLGSGSLVVQRDGHLAASEFAQVHIDHSAISVQVWDYLLGAYEASPAQRLNLGIVALESGTPQRALRAFESILFYRDRDLATAGGNLLVEVIARRGIALYHARLGRHEQAIMVYTDLVDTYGSDPDPDICEQVAQALLGIGISFSELGSHGQAVSAYTELVRRFSDHPSPILDSHVAKALLGQAVTLGHLGRHEEEIAAYRDIVDRYGDGAEPGVEPIVELARTAVAARE